MEPEVCTVWGASKSFWCGSEVLVQQEGFHHRHQVPAGTALSSTQPRPQLTHRQELTDQARLRLQKGHLPNGGIEFVQLLCSQCHLGKVIGKDLSSQVEAYIPVILHLLQTAFSSQQAAQLHAWERAAWAQVSVVVSLGYNIPVGRNLEMGENLSKISGGCRCSGTGEGLGISVYGVQWVRNTGVSLQAIVDPKDSEGPGQV